MYFSTNLSGEVLRALSDENRAAEFVKAEMSRAINKFLAQQVDLVINGDSKTQPLGLRSKRGEA